MAEGSAVHVEKFARVYTDGPEALPPDADTYHDPEQGYYFKLHLDDVTAEEATPLLSKARQTFDVEVVRRITKDGFYKERVYVEDPSDVPEGYKVEEGPSGGTYYETGVQDVASVEPGGGESRRVAVIHWEDVDVGDEIIYQTSGGEEVFAPIADIEGQGGEANVIHVEVDGETERAVPGTYEVDRDLGKAEGSDGGDATHNARHSETELPDVCRLCDNDRKDGSMVCEECAEDVEKGCDGHYADSFTNGTSVRLQEGEVYCEESGEVYSDAAIDGVVGACPECDEMVHLGKIQPDTEETEKDCDGHHERDGSVWCEESEESYLPDVVESNNEVCPGCGKDVNVVGLMTEKSFNWLTEDDLKKDSGPWTYYVGPDGGEGWISLSTGEKRYQKQRPGEAPEDGDGYGDWLGDGWEEPPEDLSGLQEGQIVEFQDPNGEYHEGEVEILDPEGEYAKVSGDSIDGLVGPSGDDELTAVEEVEMPTAFDVGEQVHLMTEDLPEDHPEYMDEPASIGDVTIIDGEAYYEVNDESGTMINEFSEAALEDLVLDGTGGDGGSDDILGDIEEDFEDFGGDADDEAEALLDEIEEETSVDDPSLSITDFSEGDQIMYEDDDGQQQTGVIDYLADDYAVLEDNSYVGEYGDPDQALLDGFVTGPEPAEGSAGAPGPLAEGSTHEVVWEDDAVPDEPISAEVEYTDGELGFRVQDGVYEGAWVHEDEVANVDELAGETEPIDVEPGDTVEVESSVGTFEVEVVDVQGDDYIVDDGDDEFEVYEEDIVGVSEGSDDSSGFADQLEDEDPEDMTPAEEEFLAEHDIEPGGTFMHNGLESIITGAETMMQDGEPSHVSVYVPESDTTVPLHPNSVPEHATVDADEDGVESEGTGPSEEEMDSAVAESPSAETGYDLGGYTPEDVEEYRDMSDIGANHGNSVAAMEVAVLPDGSKMVEKDVAHHSVTQDDIEREVAGYAAGKHLDGNIPTHTADVHDGWAASEVVPGVDAKDATPEMKEAVSEEDFYEMAATQVILGNADLHQNNVRVDESGGLHPFDLDRCGGDIQGNWVGNLDGYDNTLDRILGELNKSATALGVQMDRQALLEHAQAAASEIDEETLDAMYDDAADVNSSFASNIVSNVKALANGKVTA